MIIIIFMNVSGILMFVIKFILIFFIYPSFFKLSKSKIYIILTTIIDKSIIPPKNRK
jgi:hypothetical protein